MFDSSLSVNSVVHNIGSSQVATVERDNIGKGKHQCFQGSTFCSRKPLDSRLKLSNSLFHFFTMGLRMWINFFQGCRFKGGA